MANALLDIQKEHGKQIQVYIDVAESEEVLSKEAIQQRASELERKEQAGLEKRTSRPQWRPKEYQTEFGLRQFAMDPSTNRMVMDLSGMMQHDFGYDPPGRVPHVQFVERQARLENESFAKAKAEGKHLNTRLCSMCRYVKPLQPKADGHRFTWEPVREFMPFGNWIQLSYRHSCSICRLVLSCITGEPLDEQPSSSSRRHRSRNPGD